MVLQATHLPPKGGLPLGPASLCCLHSIHPLSSACATHIAYTDQNHHTKCTTIKTPHSQNTTQLEHHTIRPKSAHNQNTTKCALAKLSWGIPLLLLTNSDCVMHILWQSCDHAVQRNKGSQLWMKTAAACLSTARSFCCKNIIIQQEEEEDQMWTDR